MKRYPYMEVLFFNSYDVLKKTQISLITMQFKLQICQKDFLG